MVELGIRYTLNKLMYVQTAYFYRVLVGGQTSNNKIISGIIDNPINLKSFNTTMSQDMLSSLFNLRRVFSGKVLLSEPENLNNWNYYLVLVPEFLNYATDIAYKLENTVRVLISNIKKIQKRYLPWFLALYDTINNKM